MQSSNKILFLTRKWNFLFFKDLSEYFDNDVSFFREESLEKNSSINNNYFNQVEVNEIIKNCRLLRNIDSEGAIARIKQSCNNALYIINKDKPKYVISLTVDNYHLDIFNRICIKSDVTFVGLVNSLIPGYVRVTSQGEPNFSNQGPSKEFLLDFYEAKLRPAHFIKANKYILLTRNFMFFMRRIYFNIKYYFGNRSYHTLVNFYWHKRGRVGTLKESGAVINKKNFSILLPLQYSPECTIDYWAPIEPSNNYESFIENIVCSCPNHNFLIKEHPMYYGQRKVSFINFIQNLSNCDVVNVEKSTYDLFEKVNVIATLTGTVAVEALLSNNKVWLMSDSIPYFMNGLEVSDGINDIGCIIKPTKENKDKMIKNISDMLIPGSISLQRKYLGYNWDKVGLRKLATSLKSYLKN